MSNDRELGIDELDAVSGGDGKVPPATKQTAPKETITFQYGALAIQYAQQD